MKGFCQPIALKGSKIGKRSTNLVNQASIHSRGGIPTWADTSKRVLLSQRLPTDTILFQSWTNDRLWYTQASRDERYLRHASFEAYLRKLPLTLDSAQSVKDNNAYHLQIVFCHGKNYFHHVYTSKRPTEWLFSPTKVRLLLQALHLREACCSTLIYATCSKLVLTVMHTVIQVHL